ncbi:hypothetical protein LTR08_000102 [Meristemomyces frigidus]|nr:hypothetical protein LTR08_000102 [Meristemomyces frigidus]
MAQPTALQRDLREREKDEEVYDENADEDFHPDGAAEEDASSSEDGETMAAKSATESRKRKTEVVGELDSGDEATIKERKRKRRKKNDVVTAVGQDEESGGDGGFVRTRAQRHADIVERKERKRATVGEVTIDVEEVWAALSSVSVGRPSTPPPKMVQTVETGGEQKKKEIAPTTKDDLITITRRIEYAGDITEVEETIPRTSKVAQLYLKEHPEADPDYKPPPADASAQLHRPLKRPSMFEPNPTATVKGVPPERLRTRVPSRFDVLMLEKREEAEGKKKAEKMTTVQKSALDWKGYVDQQGLRGELDEYGKSKGGYLAREDFLGRAELAREDAARNARAKG